MPGTLTPRRGSCLRRTLSWPLAVAVTTPGRISLVQVAMLGPLEVRADSGCLLEVGGARLRALLILLALEPVQVVTTSRLVDAL